MPRGDWEGGCLALIDMFAALAECVGGRDRSAAAAAPAVEETARADRTSFGPAGAPDAARRPAGLSSAVGFAGLAGGFATTRSPDAGR